MKLIVKLEPELLPSEVIDAMDLVAQRMHLSYHIDGEFATTPQAIRDIDGKYYGTWQAEAGK